MDDERQAILDRFSKIHLLVVGEAILDSAVRGAAGRLSLDAPVPVVEARETRDLPGGAASAAVNAARLGARVELLSVIGDDAEGDALLALLRAEGVETGGMLRAPGRRTLLRRRIYAAEQLLLRYDQGDTDDLAEAEQDALFAQIQARRADVLVLSDYGQGLLPRRLLERLSALPGLRVVADTRRLEAYRGLRLAAVRPSYASAIEALNGSAQALANSGQALTGAAGEQILARLDAQMVAITLDDDGALLLDRAAAVYHTYAPRMPFNRVSGAGDAFVAGLALSLAAGAAPALVGEIASAAASLSVQRDGQPGCCIEELRAFLDGDQKLVEDWSQLESRLADLRRQGKRIVFTNGVFDILHSAHVAYLNQARSYGDVLVIGVNTDESVRALKGPQRPVNALIERCRVLAGLSCVDLVSPFGGQNPIPLIHHVRPDVYVKGGDYTRETLPEAAVVEGYGGRLELVPYIANHSTTGVIERIRSLDGKKG